MEQMYTRKGHIIRDMEGKVVFESEKKSRNAAKRESAKLQKAKGGLGSGLLRVVAAPPIAPPTVALARMIKDAKKGKPKVRVRNAKKSFQKRGQKDG